MNNNQPLAVTQFIRSLDYYDIPFNDLKHLLQSKHSNLVEIFTALLHRPKYQPVAQQLVQNMLDNMYKMVSDKLEIHIINNIWKSEFLRLFDNSNNNRNNNNRRQQYDVYSQNSKQSLSSSIMERGYRGGNKQRRSMSDNNNNNSKSGNLHWRVFMFLCQKMRSLKFTTRLNALKSFQSLLHSIIWLLFPPIIDNSSNLPSTTTNSNSHHQQLTIQQSQSYDTILTRQLRVMLRKQQLVKVMSYSQGLFLQLLQDEYHEIRVATLAILELVSLKTRYFTNCGTKRDYNGDTETIYALKQIILYMLNDEHELVRQRALVAIFRITESSSSYTINQPIFSPLNHQQLFTILMCLKQNNSILRQKVYQCLKILPLMNIHQLLLVLEKLYQTLLVYKLDKTKIYMLLKTFSYRHKGVMMSFIDQNPKENIRLFYDFVSEEEPSCRNFIYKGRLILLREVIKQIINLNYYCTHDISNDNENSCHRISTYRNILPEYIIRHLNYVQDTEVKLKLSQSNRYSWRELSSQLHYEEEQKIGYQHQMKKMQSKEIMGDKLRELRSVIEYQLAVREESSLDKQLLTIIKHSLEIIIVNVELVSSVDEQFKIQKEDKIQQIKLNGRVVRDERELLKRSSNRQQRVNVSDIDQGGYCWFDVLGEEESRNSHDNREQIIDHHRSNSGNCNIIDSDNSKCYRQHNYQQYQQQQTIIQQNQIINLLYTDRYYHTNSTFHQLAVSKQSLSTLINRLLFEIETIRYVFNFNNNNNNNNNNKNNIHHHISQQQQQSSINTPYDTKITHVNRILIVIQHLLLSFLNSPKQVNAILVNNSSRLCQVVRAYLRSTWIYTTIKNKQFKIRPITIGRMVGSGGSIVKGGGYSERLLIIVEHPYKIDYKEQFLFHNDHLWLQLLCTYNNNINTVNKIKLYLRFEDLFRLSEMRPLIDYNENKTIYTAQLTVKINSTKFNNIVEAAGRVGNNATKLQSLQQKEITINTVAIIYSAQESYDKHNKQPQSHYKILAQWSRSSNNVNLNQ